MRRNEKVAKQLLKIARQIIADGEQLQLQVPEGELTGIAEQAADNLSDLNEVGEQIKQDLTETVEQIDEDLDNDEQKAQRVFKACKIASKQASLKVLLMKRNAKIALLKKARNISADLQVAAEQFASAAEYYHDVHKYAKKLKKARITKVAWAPSFLKGLFQKHQDVQENLDNKEKGAQQAVSEVVKNAKKAVIEKWNAFVKAFNDFIEKAKNLFNTYIAEPIANAVEGAITAVTNGLTAGAQAIQKFISDAKQLSKATAIFVGKFTLSALLVAIGTALFVVIKAAQGLAFIGKVIGDSFIATVNGIADALKTAHATIKKLIEDFGKFVIDLKGRVLGRIEQIKKSAEGQIEQEKEKIRAIADQIVTDYNSYKEAAFKLGKDIQEALRTPGRLIAGAIKGVIEGISADVTE